MTSGYIVNLLDKRAQEEVQTWIQAEDEVELKYRLGLQRERYTLLRIIDHCYEEDL